MTDLADPKPVVIAPSSRLLKLDFGCGQNPREGFEGVDLYAPEPKHRVDLFKLPLPWADNSVSEIHASHFLEHLPMREVMPFDLRADLNLSEEVSASFLGRDFLLAFMDECYRILCNEGVMHIVVPNARSNRAYQDPTHRRFFVMETFYYFNADTRKQMGLSHYQASCHFGFEVYPIIPSELSVLSNEAQARRFNENWNTVLDWSAKLKALKT